MMQIIKLTDVNVDGYGTNIETVIQIEGKAELTNGIIETVVYSITTDQYGQATFGDASLANQCISVVSNDYRYGVFWVHPNNIRVFDIS